jgi:hypothetical protein
MLRGMFARPGRFETALIGAAWAATSSACADEAEPDPVAGTDGGSTVAGESGPSTSESAMASVSGVAIEFPAMTAVAGIAACWFDHAEHPCVTTDDEGQFVLEGLPGGAEVTIELTADGYVPQLAVLLLPTEGMVSIVHTAIPQAVSDTVVEGLGAELDPTKGNVSGDAYGPGNTGIPGIALSMTPTSGLGPAYGQTGGLPTTSLDATEDGSALWINVDPGEVVVTATAVDGSADCTISPIALPADSADATRVPVVAGYLTHFVHFTCS